MGLEKPGDHRPVFFTLRLFCSYEVGECQEFDRLPRHVDGRPSRPEGLKRWQSAKGAHHIETNASGVWNVAAKVDRKSGLEMGSFKGRYRDHLGLKLGNGSLEPSKVGMVGDHDDVGVSAKLRSAVDHAGLPPHEQISDAIPVQRRKDSEDRARGQGSLPGRDTWPKVWRIPRCVAAATRRTTRAIPRRRGRKGRERRMSPLAVAYVRF